MRENGITGLKSPLMLSAVSTAITPGAACAALGSVLMIRACDCSLRRKAACNARSGLRSAVYSPRPVRSRGSSVRLIGAPTCRGRSISAGCTRLSLFIALVSFAQALPLFVVMAADDGRSGLLHAPDILERLQLRLYIP